MLSCSVLTSPPTVWSPQTLARAQRPTIRLCKAACLPYLPLFPHLVKFLANTVQINTSCKDYDSISQHSHQSTRTTGPQGGDGEERRWSTYICTYLNMVCPASQAGHDLVEGRTTGVPVLSITAPMIVNGIQQVKPADCQIMPQRPQSTPSHCEGKAATGALQIMRADDSTMVEGQPRSLQAVLYFDGKCPTMISRTQFSTPRGHVPNLYASQQITVYTGPTKLHQASHCSLSNGICMEASAQCAP